MDTNDLRYELEQLESELALFSCTPEQQKAIEEKNRCGKKRAGSNPGNNI